MIELLIKWGILKRKGEVLEKNSSNFNKIKKYLTSEIKIKLPGFGVKIKYWENDTFSLKLSYPSNYKNFFVNYQNEANIIVDILKKAEFQFQTLNVYYTNEIDFFFISNGNEFDYLTRGELRKMKLKKLKNVTK